MPVTYKYTNEEDLLAAICKGYKEKYHKRDKAEQSLNFPGKPNKNEQLFSPELVKKLLDPNKLFELPGYVISKKPNIVSLNLDAYCGILSYAIELGNKPALQALLREIPDLVEVRRLDEIHPLYRAAEKGSIDMVNILLNAGVNPNDLICKFSNNLKQQLFENNNGSTVIDGINILLKQAKTTVKIRENIINQINSAEKQHNLSEIKSKNMFDMFHKRS